MLFPNVCTLPCPLLQALVEPASDDEEEEESGSEAGSDSDVEAMSGSEAEAGELAAGRLACQGCG